MTNPPDNTPSVLRKAPDAAVAAVPLPGKVRAASVSRLLSHAIFAGAQEVEIEHNGAVYRLRQTALGKLILTK